MERIAEEFHFHPAYLNRLFKKEKGVSVGQFLINERMKLAGAIPGDRPVQRQRDGGKGGILPLHEFLQHVQKILWDVPCEISGRFPENKEAKLKNEVPEQKGSGIFYGNVRNRKVQVMFRDGKITEKQIK